MTVDLMEGEIKRILEWAERATQGSYSTVEDGTLLTIEEDALIKKLETALEKSGKM